MNRVFDFSKKDIDMIGKELNEESAAYAIIFGQARGGGKNVIFTHPNQIKEYLKNARHAAKKTIVIDSLSDVWVSYLNQRKREMDIKTAEKTLLSSKSTKAARGSALGTLKSALVKEAIESQGKMRDHAESRFLRMDLKDAPVDKEVFNKNIFAGQSGAMAQEGPSEVKADKKFLSLDSLCALQTDLAKSIKRDLNEIDEIHREIMGRRVNLLKF